MSDQYTWKKFVMICYTKKQREMIADITALGINQDVPAKTTRDLIFFYNEIHHTTLLKHPTSPPLYEPNIN